MNLLLASHRIGRLFGIDIHIAYSLYIIIALYTLQSLHAGFYAIILMLLLPVCILAHELGHSLVSQRYGVKVNRIVLHMLGGAAEIGGLIPGPRAEIIIALMGPIVSLCIAGLAYYLLRINPQHESSLLFYNLMYMNMFLALFNLLPVFPMDGGRVALATATLLAGPEKALKLVKPLSIAGIVILCGYGIYLTIMGNQSGMMLILIGLLVYFQGNQELQARMYAARYSSMQNTANTNYSHQSKRDASFKDIFSSKSKHTSDPENESIIASWKRKRREAKESREAKKKAERSELDRRVDEVLKKVKQEGIANLSPGEKAILQSASKKYKSDTKK